MDFLLFTFYLAVTLWLVIKTPFFKKLPVLPLWVLAGLFLLKVAAGIYYGWFFTHLPNYRVAADTWRMYYESLVETDWIKTDPAGFIGDLFSPRYKDSGGILATSHSYWNDIKSVLVVKLMAVCNLLSGGRYYVNLIFFEYLSLFGPVALCRLFIQYFPQRKWYIIAGAFLFPSTLLWCSGFHKEGLLFTSLAMVAWLVHQVMCKKARFFPVIFFILFHLLIIFLLRNYLAFFFVAWCIPWVAACKFPRYKWALFTSAAILYAGLFFATIYLKPLPDLPQKLAERQEEFLKIGGESLVESHALQGNVRGYADAFPNAVVNGFLQPLPWKIKKVSYLPAAAEAVVFIALLINTMYVFIKRKRNVQNAPILTPGAAALLLFCSFFCFSIFLLTGYTIPYLGAIVRYKAVVWPFIVVPLLTMLSIKHKNIRKINMGIKQE